MKIGTLITSLTVLATMATAVLAPAAMADSRQKNKNDWRNLAGVGAAVAGYSAYRYEKDRHSQSQQSAAATTIGGATSFISLAMNPKKPRRNNFGGASFA